MGWEIRSQREADVKEGCSSLLLGTFLPCAEKAVRAAPAFLCLFTDSIPRVVLSSALSRGSPQCRELYQISYPWDNWGNCVTLGFSVRKSLGFYTKLKPPTIHNQQSWGYSVGPFYSFV